MAATNSSGEDIQAGGLVEAIRDAYAGKPTLGPLAAQVLMQASAQPAPPGHDLTPRERF